MTSVLDDLSYIKQLIKPIDVFMMNGK